MKGVLGACHRDDSVAASIEMNYKNTEPVVAGTEIMSLHCAI